MNLPCLWLDGDGPSVLGSKPSFVYWSWRGSETYGNFFLAVVELGIFLVIEILEEHNRLHTAELTLQHREWLNVQFSRTSYALLSC